HLRNGKSLTSLGDTIQIGAAELILRTTVPRQFTDGQHPFDYCNVANYWMRTSQNPYQPRVLYLMANFVSDVARSNKLHTSASEPYGYHPPQLRDRLLLASAGLLAGWPKMPGERDCYARFMKEWINNWARRAFAPRGDCGPATRGRPEPSRSGVGSSRDWPI